MKVLGQMMNRFVDWGQSAPRRVYTVLEVQKAFVSTKGINQSYDEWEWNDCFVSIASGMNYFHIKYKNELELRNGNYYAKEPALLTEEMAKRLIREIATKELVDLDEYGLGLYYYNKSAVPVENKIDRFGEYIPLTIAFAEGSQGDSPDE